MPDIKQWIEQVERVAPPDQWNEIGRLSDTGHGSGETPPVKPRRSSSAHPSSWWKVAVIVVAFALTAAATGLVVRAFRSDPVRTIGSPLPPAPSAAPALLTVVTQVQYRGGFFTEGAVSYLRVTTQQGVVVFRRAFRAAPAFQPLIDDHPLQPGRYRVISYQRPCDGSCSALDPPRGRCSTVLELGSGKRTLITVDLTPPKPCSMSIEPRAEVGKEYPFKLYTHCGIGDLFFDGRRWAPRGRLVEGALPSPAGFGDPFEKGTLRLLDEGLLEFTGRSGGDVRFEPLPRDSAPRFLVCY